MNYSAERWYITEYHRDDQCVKSELQLFILIDFFCRNKTNWDVPLWLSIRSR
jgi:hypothetical protein